MSSKFNLSLSLAAGLIGGALSHYISPERVHAQAAAPAPKEIRAQRFTLVNESGAVLGTFSIDSELADGRPKGAPTIKLFDEDGREIWSAGGNMIRPLSHR
jgi:hypothetical protein